MINKVFLIGNLGRDPEIRGTKTGNLVCKFSIAVSEKIKGEDGTWRDHTEWVNIAVWGKMGDVCHTYLFKGSKVHIEGKLRYGKYTGQDGIERSTTEVHATRVEFLTPKGQASYNRGEQQAAPTPGTSQPGPVSAPGPASIPPKEQPGATSKASEIDLSQDDKF